MNFSMLSLLVAALLATVHASTVSEQYVRLTAALAHKQYSLFNEYVQKYNWTTVVNTDDSNIAHFTVVPWTAIESHETDNVRYDNSFAIDATAPISIGHGGGSLRTRDSDNVWELGTDMTSDQANNESSTMTTSDFSAWMHTNWFSKYSISSLDSCYIDRKNQHGKVMPSTSCVKTMYEEVSSSLFGNEEGIQCPEAVACVVVRRHPINAFTTWAIGQDFNAVKSSLCKNYIIQTRAITQCFECTKKKQQKCA